MKIMKNNHKMFAVVAALTLGIALAIPALGQDTSPSVAASSSIRQASEDTRGAVQNAYTGAVTAAEDTAITAEVKSAFATGKDIRSGDIHVTTTAGIVTLEGQVQSSDVAARAAAIASNTEGVRGVTNDLHISATRN